MKEATDEHGSTQMTLSRGACALGTVWFAPHHGNSSSIRRGEYWQNPCLSVAKILKPIFLKRAPLPSMKRSGKASFCLPWDGCDLNPVIFVLLCGFIHV